MRAEQQADLLVSRKRTNLPQDPRALEALVDPQAEQESTAAAGPSPETNRSKGARLTANAAAVGAPFRKRSTTCG